MWGILFGVSNASICGLMPQKIAGHFFGWFKIFDFLAHIWNFWIFFCHSWHVIASENAEFDFNSHKINDSFSYEVTSWHGRPKRCKNFKYGPKMSKNSKLAENNVLQFPEASDHIWMHLICQTKSPMYRVKVKVSISCVKNKLILIRSIALPSFKCPSSFCCYRYGYQ